MQLQNVIIIMGPPGSGKGTQSKLLVGKLGYAYFSMGDTLREYAKQDTDLGRNIKNTIDQGIIVTDEVAKQIFEESFTKLLDKPGIVIDGYPRTAGQVEVLSQILKKFGIVNLKVFFLDVDKQQLLKRLSLRRDAQQRADDVDILAVEKRFDEYHEKTEYVKNYYESKDMLIHINGDKPIEAVHQEILNRLGLK